MGGARGALERGVRLEEEIPVSDVRDGAVDDGAVARVEGAVCVGRLGGEEAGVMSLADDDDC